MRPCLLAHASRSHCIQPRPRFTDVLLEACSNTNADDSVSFVQSTSFTLCLFMGVYLAWQPLACFVKVGSQGLMG